MGEWRAVGGGHSATHFKKSNSIKDRQGLPQSGHIRATKDSNQSDFLGQGWMGNRNA